KPRYETIDARMGKVEFIGPGRGHARFLTGCLVGADAELIIWRRHCRGRRFLPRPHLVIYSGVSRGNTASNSRNQKRKTKHRVCLESHWILPPFASSCPGGEEPEAPSSNMDLVYTPILLARVRFVRDNCRLGRAECPVTFRLPHPPSRRKATTAVQYRSILLLPHPELAVQALSWPFLEVDSPQKIRSQASASEPTPRNSTPSKLGNWRRDDSGKMQREKPSFMASRTRASAWLTARTSPASPTSPISSRRG